jgi:hypothetical protein
VPREDGAARDREEGHAAEKELPAFMLKVAEENTGNY